MKKSLFIASAIFPLCALAQDELVKKIEKNSSDSAKAKFVFTKGIDLERTSVKNQASSGTCWSYSTNSFLESEMMRAGKKPVELAQIYSARNVYLEKADAYIRMHGSVAWGDGGACHDVINMYAKYGAMPQSAYTGLNYGMTKNKFAEMQAVLQGMLDALVKNPNGKLSPNWKKAFTAVMDSYLGEVPETFKWNGKTYTPESFADEVVGLNANNYVELSSFTDKPYYKKTMLMVPDNWSFDKVYNVKMKDMTDIIDYALEKGYSVSWATDVSEKSFSWKNGVAYVPEKDYDDMNDSEKKEMFNGPKPERAITPAMRQQGFDNYSTTDDHGMHIVGTATDQTGREYYLVKNSWGTTNDYKGYLYVTKAYVQYKTTAFLLNKNGVPPAFRQKMNMN
ncbi:MAG TPA: C1 family peptidase [Chitinophagaceae bacterium]|nr:C1 family peptidase [Chitinophagaceae bacterium]